MTRTVRRQDLRAEPEDRPRHPARTKKPAPKKKEPKSRRGGAAPGTRRLGLIGTILVALIWAGIGGAALVAWYAYDLPDISELTAAVLVRRGYSDPAIAQRFIHGEQLPHDPFLLGGMEAACAHIRTAVEQRRRICVECDPRLSPTLRG